MKKILYILGVMLVVASCTKTNEGFDNPTSGDGAVQFMASAPTRVTEDSEWQADDRIGVFAGDASNVEYKIKDDNSGVMEYVAGTEIYAPSSGTQNYYAYYPYDANIEGSKLSVDLTTNQLPLVWAKPEDKSGSSVTFDFKHQLVKLNLTFTAGGADIANLDGATATLKGANSKGEFDVATGVWSSSETEAVDLPLTIATTETSTTLTIYVMPTTSPNTTTTIEINADGKSFVWQPTTTAWEVGNSYDYDITVGDIPTWSGSIATGFESGEGTTAENPFIIANGEQLAYLAQQVNDNINAYDNTYFKLTNNINLNGYEWTPIGSYNDPFKGTFDGGGNTISGLKISTYSSNYVGLFGGVAGNIQNVNTKGSIESTSGCVGAIVGRLNSGSVSNCSNEASVQGFQTTGGVVGEIGSGASVINCSNSGTITSTDNRAGGVAGNNYGGSISYCVNTGNIIGVVDTNTGSYIGGIVGTIYNDGTVSYCHNEGDVSGSNNIGGVAGDNSSGAITSCYNEGGVSGSDNIGGVAGSATGSITSCYNDGGVSGSNYVGGIAGSIYALVSNCYNIGAVSLTGDSGYKGEVVGRCADYWANASSAEVANCYYLGDTAGLGVGTIDTYYIAGGYPVAAYNKSTAEMTGGSFASTLGSDFKEDYTAPNQVNDGYPILSWQ